MTIDTVKGSTAQFDKNWKLRSEAAYNHWTDNKPINQIQLAFRSHWEVFNELMGTSAEKKGSCLEVGCGRGSLSNYFAQAGWKVTLLDYSNNVLFTAKNIFQTNSQKADFVAGDTNHLGFKDGSFDVLTSIGLLEHFENVGIPIKEQIRVLKNNGWFFGYIVPERPDNIQKYFKWINSCLKFFFVSNAKKVSKEPVYRSDFGSSHYIRAIEGLPYKNLQVFGMYPMPMISHSPEFPFSLMPKPFEFILVQIFKIVLALRKIITGKHGWICSENMGQAFLVAFQKQ